MQPLVFGTPVPEDIIIGDLTSEPLPVLRGIDPTPRLVACGYRSVLGISTRVGDDLLALAFWSKQRHAYDRRDVSMARRIADHIAVAVSHERLSKAGGNAASRSSGGAGVDDTVRTVCAEINRKSRTIIVGQSADWQGVLKKAAQVAATDTTVLVSGESGTGKEVVARFIHQASARKRGPFVALNCAALPEQLLEAELFGYERGAFTGAQQAKPGQIELAAGGVLFLDEVSEMSLAAQAKFLRVLQEREFQRLGGTRLLKANIRVVAATNRDLREAVERGDFREDLFYRLQVFDIHIAPLRERRADILPLSEAFLQELGRSFARPPAGVTGEAREALLKVRLAGERPRIAQRPRACGDPVRGRAHHRTASLPRIHRQAVSQQRHHRPRHHGADHDRQGAAGLPVEQVGGGQASRLVANAALRPHAEAQP